MDTEPTVPFMPPAVTPTWEVRAYQPDDEQPLLALYERVFKRPRAAGAWRWKLRGRNPPFETVWVAVTPTGEIVGHYGGIPLRLKLGERVVPAVHAVEAMTDPAYRRQGMLTRLGEAAHTAWAAAGQEAVIGLPNDQWGTRNWALGYRPLFPLAWLRFPLHVERVLARPGKLPRPLARPAVALGAAGSRAYRWHAGRRLHQAARAARVHIAEVPAPGPDFDALWQTLAAAYPNFIVRDHDWVRWRFGQSGGFRYRVLVAYRERQPVGYLAYRLAQDPDYTNGYLADLFLAPKAKDVAAALLEPALTDLSRRGAGTVLATAVPGSALHRMLRTLGFLPARVGFTFEIVPLTPTLDLATLADPQTWHLTAGDFDVI